MATGFTFGSTPNTQNSGFGGSTSFGSTINKPATLGTFGNTATTSASTGFGTGTATTGGFALPVTTQKTGLGAGLSGFNTAQTTAGITFGTPSTATTTASSGFTIGGTSVTGQASSGGFQFGGAKTTASLTLGAPAVSQSTGFALAGGFGTTTTASTTAATSSAPGTGIFLGASTSVTSSNTAATSSAAGSGLGGVDPKTSIGTSGSGTAYGKSSDGKAIKETLVPQQIGTTVEDFKKYVKEQKNVRENIARMSSKPMFKVQEEVASMKQLLALVSNGLQRNAITIEKLKMESAMELKYAEMAQRTKDTPAGLQYENTLPSEYFHSLVEKFDYSMLLYRQQIEDTENHLASFNQGMALSPQDLAQLLNKLHESFVALAAQLQSVHEAVKSQKEQYLNYRKVFHKDTSDIFEKRKRAAEVTGSSVSVTTVGPTPFTGISNAAAQAMASALTRTQQPTPVLGQTVLGQQPTVVGFGLQTGGTSGVTAGMFGATNTQGTGLFGGTAPTAGTGLFGAQTTPASGSLFSKPLGSTGTGGFGFGGTGTATTTTQNTGFSFASNPTATVRPLGFGTPATAPPAQNTSGFGFGVASPQQQTGFQLQNPPIGNKRGKKA